jgi:hypothetical protein
MNMKQLLTVTPAMLTTLFSQAQHTHNHAQTTPKKDTVSKATITPSFVPTDKKVVLDTVPQNHAGHNHSSQPAAHNQKGIQIEGH